MGPRRVGPRRAGPERLRGPPASHDNPRELRTCTFQGLALQTPPKFHEKTPKREKKERKLWRERKKSAKFWAPHPSGLHPSGLPPFSGCIAHQFGKDCPTQPYFPPFCIFGSFGESYLLLQVLGEDTALAWSGEAPKESIEQSLC